MMAFAVAFDGCGYAGEACAYDNDFDA
jgi:hypothetical protein